MQERGDEVAVAADVDAVARDAAEAERRRRGRRTSIGVARSGDRARSERQLVDFARGPRRADRRRGAARRSATAGSARPAPAARAAGACTTASARRRRDRRARRAARSSRRWRAGSSGMRRFRYSRRSTATCSLRERPGVQPAAGVADARDRARARRTRGRPRRRARRSRTPGRRAPAARISRSPRSMAAASAAERTPARARPAAHARLPRTSSSNSRRSKRNDDPNAKSSASGSPANRPDQRCAISEPIVSEDGGRRLDGWHACGAPRAPSASGGRRRGSRP